MKIIDDFKENKNRFLMNSYACTVTVNGLKFPSVEHAFQAAKTKSDASKETIRQAVSARAAKRLGRSLTLPSNWDSEKDSVMEELLRIKFTDVNLKRRLLNTGNARLVAGGDDYWGEVNGYGQNRLGIMLMELRTAIVKSNFDMFMGARYNFLVSSGWAREPDGDDYCGECWVTVDNKDCYYDVNSALACQVRHAESILNIDSSVGLSSDKT